MKVKHLYIKTFVIALAVAVLVFLPAMIYDNGYFIFVGDFNSQQIPFYMNAHDAIRNGEWGWNWYTDLGANFIGSYTFYLLGSPFFWLTIPFPRWMVPHLMGPLLMLKFAMAAWISCIYFKRYVKHDIMALLGGLLYAFSGFSIYNIFFNHFHEAIVFFPLMLIALDEWMDHGTRGVFALAVALNALINYFFFFGEVVFVVLYYFVRLLTGGYEKSWPKFGVILVEAVLGFMMSGILMLPSALSVLQNSRVDNFPSGWNVWVYYNRFRNYSILNNFLFPPELPSKQILIPDGNAKWTSLSAYVPIFSITGVLTFMQQKRRNWLTTFIKVLVIMAIVPGLNALFVAFNAAYYARWYYMLTMMLVLATVRALDQGLEVRLRRNTLWILALTVVITLAIGLTPQFSNGDFKRIGLYDEEFWYFFVAIAAAAIFGLITLLMFMPGLHKSPHKFGIRMIVAVCVFSVLYGNFFIVWGKTRSYDTKNYIIPDAIEGESKITIPDKDEVMRIDVDDSLINMGMFWNISCMRAFHSIVPTSIMDFYTYIGEKRDVSSKIPESQYAVRGLLSVHWYFDRIGSSDDFGDINGETTTMPGYTYYADMANYHVWENDYYIPMGFTYDEYILKSELDQVADSSKAAMMLHAVALSDETAYKYFDVLEHCDEVGRYLCTPFTYEADCTKHQLETVQNLKRNTKGITCTSDFTRDRLVYFSIPYDDGWSCTVDGASVEIEKVNIGFMAIKVPAGEHEISFTYQTPGLKWGAVISLVGLLGLVGYYIMAIKRDKQKEAAAKLAPRELTEAEWREFLAEDMVTQAEEEAIELSMEKEPTLVSTATAVFTLEDEKHESSENPSETV